MLGLVLELGLEDGGLVGEGDELWQGDGDEKGNDDVDAPPALAEGACNGPPPETDEEQEDKIEADA
jgi:hypothetical protein